MSKKQQQQQQTEPAQDIVRITLARGEVTGHAHVALGVGLLFDQQTGVLTVPKEAEVVHEEHGTVKVPAGKYKVGLVKEEDPFSTELRPVRD
jgi:hypothetical protein